MVLKNVGNEALAGWISEKSPTRAVILDLGDVAVISDWGLQIIFGVARELQSRDVKLVLCALSARVREKFRVTGLDQFLPVHESRAEALAFLES